ncbi:GDSL-type esterase/lipase family protein [Sulfurospirillum sp. 1612]|uniref:GDSL-type esterase/lipase family protein n=1 Tax=Sulfurospirillum sp. 1612 TaxID=3094835 RepID=UPI002F934AA4
MSFFKIVVLIAATIALFSFINNQEDEDDGNYFVPEKTTIVAFGDSITKGYRVDDNASYPAQLSNLLHTNVINAGISGEDTSRGLLRLPSVLKKYKPNILILCEGGNDILRGQDLRKTKENLAQMIQLAQKQHIFVILVGVPKLDILRVTTASFYEDLAAQFHVPLADDILQTIVNDDTLKIDDVHPNAKGYTLLSKKIAEIVTNQYIDLNI